MSARIMRTGTEETMHKEPGGKTLNVLAVFRRASELAEDIVGEGVVFLTGGDAYLKHFGPAMQRLADQFWGEARDENLDRLHEPDLIGNDLTEAADRYAFSNTLASFYLGMAVGHLLARRGMAHLTSGAGPTDAGDEGGDKPIMH
jgi:hypothetical protein